MKAVLPIGPKLDATRAQQIAAPKLRSGYRLSAKLGLQLDEASDKISPSLEWLTLVRGPRANLALARTGREIGCGFLLRGSGYLSFDANLSSGLSPIKAQCGIGIGLNLFGLTALVVGEEQKPRLID
jgi:hypothetical protein